HGLVQGVAQVAVRPVELVAGLQHLPQSRNREARHDEAALVAHGRTFFVEGLPPAATFGRRSPRARQWALDQATGRAGSVRSSGLRMASGETFRPCRSCAATMTGKVTPSMVIGLP